MIRPEFKELLQALPKSPYGNALKELLTDYQAELNDVTTLKNHEEAIGRTLALELIDKIFYFYGEKSKPRKKTTYT
jgi:hypothetical protein